MTKYRATIPGTENVLVGTLWDPVPGVKIGPRTFLGRFQVPDPAGGHWTMDLYDPWVVEPIIELPTKRNAIIRYGSVTLWLGPEGKWIDHTGDKWATYLVKQETKLHGGFEVIFEGVDDE